MPKKSLTNTPADPLASLQNAEELHRQGLLTSAALANVRARVARIAGGSGITSTVSKAGSTTVPQSVREELALEAGDQLEWAPGDGYVIVRRKLSVLAQT